jgi:putative membrane protein
MLNWTESGTETPGHRIKSIVLRWLALTIGVWVAASLVPGIDTADVSSLLVAALVLGVLNSLVKPILVALALPFVVFTFGIFLLFINAFLLLLTSRLVPGFHVNGFWPAMGASLMISILSMVLGVPANFRRRRRVVMTSEARFSGRNPPPGKGPIIDV